MDDFGINLLLMLSFVFTPWEVFQKIMELKHNSATASFLHYINYSF